MSTIRMHRNRRGTFVYPRDARKRGVRRFVAVWKARIERHEDAFMLGATFLAAAFATALIVALSIAAMLVQRGVL